MTIVRFARRIGLALALVLTLAASAPSALAGKATSVVEWQTSTTISFALTPEGCYQVETAIGATATLHNDITMITYADGSRRVIDKGYAEGTALDDAGNQYWYRYRNTAVFTVPPNGSVVNVDMKDSFILKGKGSQNHVNVHFHWLWSYIPDDPNAIPTALTIPWPPPDNRVELQSVGNPLGCDPL